MKEDHIWTLEALHEHFLSKLNESDRRYEQRFIAQEKAILTALAAAEKAIDSRQEGVSSVTATFIAVTGILIALISLAVVIFR